MSTDQRSVPDLLRRFLATPLILSLPTVHFETNDPELLAVVQESDILESLLWDKAPYFVKLIRDFDAPCNGANTTLLHHGCLRTITMGMGTIAWVDVECHEILGFVAPDISAECIVTKLLPLAAKLFRDETHCSTWNDLGERCRDITR
jgi:hypothetical protein